MPKNPKAGPVVEPKHTVGFLLRLLQHTLQQAMHDGLRKQGVELSFAAVVALFGLHFEPGVPGAKLARRAAVIDKQVGTGAPAAVREKVRAALESAIADDPLLSEKIKALG